MFEKVKPYVLASGFQSPEGPSFDREGTLHFVDWDAQVVYRVAPDGQGSPFVNTGGVPTGSKFHRNGRLFVADGDRGILDISPEGEIRVHLDAPSGDEWTWGPQDAASSVHGGAEDFCLVVTQRRHLDDTDLTVEGEVARDWLERAQAFAGPATDGPAVRGS